MGSEEHSDRLVRPVRKTRKAFNTLNDAHSLTFTTYQSRPILTDPEVASAVLNSLDEARHSCDFAVWAYVVMPEHCHFLIKPRREVYDMSAILQAIKTQASRAVFEAMPELAETMTVHHARRDERRLWLPGGGYDSNISRAPAAWACIRYIHANPVERGLCLSPEEWHWSSAKAYADGDSPIPVDICDWG